MPTDPVTDRATACTPADRITYNRSNPQLFLRRLPVKAGGHGLFNDQAPGDPGYLGAMFDEETVIDAAIVGIVPGDTPTPQYEIARVISEEKDAFVHAMKEAQARQLGLGAMFVDGSSIVAASPRASADDLDRVGQQYGVGRPTGFTDCCYWRLFLLLLFQRGSTVWRLQEIAALYTGARPYVVESPCKITLIWPDGDLPSFCEQHYADWSCWASGDEDFVLPVYDTQGFAAEDGAAQEYHYYASVLDVRPSGLTLQGAFDAVKPAGVFVGLQNMPSSWDSGCFGADYRNYDEPSGAFYTA